jgi:hypothetical protein
VNESASIFMSRIKEIAFRKRAESIFSYMGVSSVNTGEGGVAIKVASSSVEGAFVESGVNEVKGTIGSAVEKVLDK